MDMTAIAIVAIIAWMIVSIFEANKKGQKKQKNLNKNAMNTAKKLSNLKPVLRCLKKLLLMTNLL